MWCSKWGRVWPLKRNNCATLLCSSPTTLVPTAADSTLPSAAGCCSELLTSIVSGLSHTASSSSVALWLPVNGSSSAGNSFSSQNLNFQVPSPTASSFHYSFWVGPTDDNIRLCLVWHSLEFHYSNPNRALSFIYTHLRFFSQFSLESLREFSPTYSGADHNVRTFAFLFV